MKLCSSSSPALHLRRLFSTYFSTQINLPPPSPPSPPPPPPPPPPPLPPLPPPRRLVYLQSVLDQIKLLSINPNNYSSLKTLDSLLSKSNSLDSATSLVLIDHLSRINKLGRIKTIISHLKSIGCVSYPLLYSLVFDFVAKDGTINDVENIWGEIYGLKSFNFSNYVILVCKFGGANEIRDVYERILIRDYGSVVLEKQSYLALIGALCNLNEGLLAKDIVKEMYDNDMLVDCWTYFLLFRCFCKIGDFDEADSVLRKLVKNGFVVDICVYGAFLHGLCKSGKLREANKLFKKLIKRGTVRVCDERGVVLKEGRRAIFQLNCEGVVPEMMAYECYFRALCNAGRLDEAEVLLKKMMKGRILPEICVYGSFVKALIRGGREKDAMKFFNVQKKKGLVRVDEIGGHVIMGLCEKGKSDDALRVFEEIVMVDGFVNSSRVCNSILDSYWRESRVGKAELLFERWRLQKGNCDVTTYGIMVNGYCSHNDVSKALVVFEEMLEKKMVVNGALYEILIRGLCDSGRVNEAFRYFNDMIESGHFLFVKRWRALFRSILSIHGLINLEAVKM